MPVVEKNLAELDAFELVPFQRAIETGVPAIMTAHIHYPQVEAENRPATFSPRFLSRLLREQMGFAGLIFTDALDMRAVTERYGLGKASLLALQAGADVIMSFSLSFEEQRAAFEQVVSAAQTGEFDMSGMPEVLARLEHWRARFCHRNTFPDSSNEDAVLIAQAAASGLSVFPSNGSTRPLRALEVSRPLLIDFVTEMESPVEEGRQSGPILERQLRRRFPALLRVEAPANPAPADVERIQTWAARSDLLIVVIRQTRRFPVQARLVKSLLETCQPSVPVVLVAAREPYDLALFENAPLSIATYGDPPATINALANLFTGL
jgi:beta-N-acetylhexosaminidase